MESKHGSVFGLGKLNNEYAKYFIGNSYLNPLSKSGEYLAIANVTFEPSCRNNWHIHKSKLPIGQILICVDGEGWYQEEGKKPIKLLPGMVIEIPSGVKHWHGATKNSWFSHIAFSIPDEESRTEWCNPVSDDEYEKL